MQQHLFSSLLSSSSEIPRSLASYCDAPRIAATNYRLPNISEAVLSNVELVHVIHVQRHHRRTPDNLIPEREASADREEWQCDNIDLYDAAMGEAGAAKIHRLYENPLWNPLHDRIWNGSCDAGQLTAQGLADSVAHGRDLASVYGVDGVNQLLTASGAGLKTEILLRTSPEERTRHVAGGLLRGIGYPDKHVFPAIVMPKAVDGIVPSYSCAIADRLRGEIEKETAWQRHLTSKRNVFDQVNGVLGTTKEPAWTSWIDHAFDVLSARQCHGHGLPRDPYTGVAITQELADQVYAEGNWEYNYIWNESPRADAYVRYSFAVFVQELVKLLDAIRRNYLHHKMTLFIGHDGTMVRLLETLGKFHIAWPGMGSEVQLEVYRASERKDRESDSLKSHFFVRILAGGKTLVTSSAALHGQSRDSTAKWSSLDSVLAYLKGRIPNDVKDQCAHR